MTVDQDMRKVSEQWIRILNKMDVDERCPKDFGSGDLFYCFEIHIIMMIGKNKDINFASFLLLLGISRNAISQMISRLVRKNLVEKHRDPDNDKEILLRLSPRGTIACLGHEQHHAKIYARMHRNLGDLTDEQFALILRFLSAMEETIDESGQRPA